MAENEAGPRTSGRHEEETKREEARKLKGGQDTDDEENEKKKTGKREGKKNYTVSKWLKESGRRCGSSLTRSEVQTNPDTGKPSVGRYVNFRQVNPVYL